MFRSNWTKTSRPSSAWRSCGRRLTPSPSCRFAKGLLPWRPCLGPCHSVHHSPCQAREAETEVLTTPGEPLFPPAEARVLDKRIWSERQIKRAKTKKAAEATPSRALSGAATTAGHFFFAGGKPRTTQLAWSVVEAAARCTLTAVPPRTSTALLCWLRGRPDRLPHCHLGGDTSPNAGLARFHGPSCRGLGNLRIASCISQLKADNLHCTPAALAPFQEAVAGVWHLERQHALHPEKAFRTQHSP